MLSLFNIPLSLFHFCRFFYDTKNIVHIRFDRTSHAMCECVSKCVCFVCIYICLYILLLNGTNCVLRVCLCVCVSNVFYFSLLLIYWQWVIVLETGHHHIAFNKLPIRVRNKRWRQRILFFKKNPYHFYSNISHTNQNGNKTH